MRRKTVTPIRPSTPITLASMSPVPEHLARIFEHFQSPGADPQWNCTGCALGEGLVLVRTYPADPYRVGVKISGRWYQIDVVKPDDPGIAGLPMTDYGPSPQQAESEQQREREKREHQEAQEQRLRDRSEHMRRMRTDKQYQRSYFQRLGSQ
jgi:hypothetical protein